MHLAAFEKAVISDNKPPVCAIEFVLNMAFLRESLNKISSNFHFFYPTITKQEMCAFCHDFNQDASSSLSD